MDNTIILHTILFFITSLVTGLGMQIMIMGHIPNTYESLDSIMPSMLTSGYIMVVDAHTLVGDISSNTRSFGAGIVVGGFTKLVAMFLRSVHKKDPIAVISAITSLISDKASGAIDKMKELQDIDDASKVDSKEEKKEEDIVDQ